MLGVRPRITATSILAAFVVLGLGACGTQATGMDPAAQYCLPGPMEIVPEAVRVGDTFRLDGQPAECALTFTADGVLTVEVVSNAEPHRTFSVEVPAADDGSFLETVALPHDWPVGRFTAFIAAGFDNDCERAQNSCAIVSADAKAVNG